MDSNHKVQDQSQIQKTKRIQEMEGLFGEVKQGVQEVAESDSAYSFPHYDLGGWPSCEDTWSAPM